MSKSIVVSARLFARRMKDRATQAVRYLSTRAPRQIPTDLRNRYTMDGRIMVRRAFRDDSFPTSASTVFSVERIERMMAMAAREEIGSYVQTDPHLFAAFRKYSDDIRDKEVVDFGSVTGWYSAVCLAYGASSSVIIEYNKLVSHHPRVIPILKSDFDRNPREFEIGTSISSFEHDGLGRYGDPIDPDGDLRAMGEAAKVIKPRGLLFLAVPVGKDAIIWNLHRVYGALRLPRLLEAWDCIDSFGFEEKDFQRDPDDAIQPVFVLRNRRGGH